MISFSQVELQSKQVLITIPPTNNKEGDLIQAFTKRRTIATEKINNLTQFFVHSSIINSMQVETFHTKGESIHVQFHKDPNSYNLCEI